MISLCAIASVVALVFAGYGIVHELLWPDPMLLIRMAVYLVNGAILVVILSLAFRDL